MADSLSLARLALAVFVFWFGAAGQGHLALTAIALAAATDVLDGRVARRRGASRHGRQLDAVADAVLLVATAAALAMLHPEMVRDQWILLAVAFASWLATRHLVDPRQLTPKLAGGALYAFALFTLATGVYAPVLLAIAAGTLVLASAEAALKAISTTQTSWTASKHRSHAPQAEKGVASNGTATASVATSARPSPTDSRP